MTSHCGRWRAASSAAAEAIAAVSEKFPEDDHADRARPRRRVDLREVVRRQPRRPDHDRHAGGDRRQRVALDRLDRRVVDQHVDPVERLGGGGEHRRAVDLPARRRAADRAAQLQVGRVAHAAHERGPVHPVAPAMHTRIGAALHKMGDLPDAGAPRRSYVLAAGSAGPSSPTAVVYRRARPPRHHCAGARQGRAAPSTLVRVPLRERDQRSAARRTSVTSRSRCDFEMPFVAVGSGRCARSRTDPAPRRRPDRLDRDGLLPRDLGDLPHARGRAHARAGRGRARRGRPSWPSRGASRSGAWPTAPGSARCCSRCSSSARRRVRRALDGARAPAHARAAGRDRARRPGRARA